jgi:hypothetical protein
MATEEKPKQQPPWVRTPDGVIEIYANLASLQWSLDDVRVRLAQLIEDPNHPTPGPEFKQAAQERAAVTFSWRNAKVLCKQLGELIAAYERANGEINLTPKLATPTGSATVVIEKSVQ